MTLQSIEAFSTFEWTSDGGQWHKASTGLNVNPYTASRSVCIDVPSNLSLCHGIGYNKMRLPNLLQHETLQEVKYTFYSLSVLYLHQRVQILLVNPRKA